MEIKPSDGNSTNSGNGNRMPENCQLIVLYDGTSPFSIFDKSRYLALRLGSAVKRRIRRVLDFREMIRGNKFLSDVGSHMNTGDLVEVLSMEEIRKTLDFKNRCDGLQFMDGMEKFAGKNYEIMKAVRFMYDERERRMLRIRDTFILKDVICDGRDVYDREGCDRSCYFFWKKAWLRKIL